MKAEEKTLVEAQKALDTEEYTLAAELLKPLCDKEIPEALSMLGVMYQLGLGVECDGGKAVKLLVRAVELGQGVAAHNLGTIYLGGTPGIDADYEKSKMYYRKAKSLGAKFTSDEFYE